MHELDRDALTQVGNRESLKTRFTKLTGERAKFVMILFDIDGFIYFNDRYGHNEGDRKLKQIAKLISQNLPPNTDVFRAGGEEFVVFLSNLEMAKVVATAMQICQVINQHFSALPPLRRFVWMPDKSCLDVYFPLTVSSGVAFYPEHSIDYDSLYHSAEEAVYNAGKNLYGGVVGVAKFNKSGFFPQK